MAKYEGKLQTHRSCHQTGQPTLVLGKMRQHWRLLTFENGLDLPWLPLERCRTAVWTLDQRRWRRCTI